MYAVQIFANCTKNSFFGIVGWYKYIPGSCKNLDFKANGVGSVWLVLAGLTDALLRIVALVSIFFFIFGAFKMIASQGSPEGIKSARSTMVNALIGLVISILGAWFIGFMLGTVFDII